MLQPHAASLSLAHQDDAAKSNHVTDYLFNNDNLIDYEIAALESLSRVHKAVRSAAKPFSGISPQTLAAAFNDIDLNIPCATTRDALDEVERLYLDHAVYFHHPKYVAHLNCPVAYPAVIAEQMLSAINTSVDTWDQSGGATLIEQKCVDWTCQRIGYDSHADGVFTSGGTQSNLMAMLVAREHAVCQFAPGHDIKHQGLPEIAARFRIFTSTVSHFSIQKSTALLGLGYNAVVPVATDEAMKMDPAALAVAMKDAKEKGLIPIAVVATAGTTDFGSIDPIAALHKVCKDQGVWLHVDAAYGGGTLTSKHAKHLLKGIAHADSVTVDYHKTFLQPVSCSGFFLKDKQHFNHITLYSDYLNPLAEAGNGTPNLVDKSLQTTRRFDALKLWLTLRIMGADAIGQAFDSVMALAKQTHLLLNEHPNFEPYHIPELSALVFRFAPKGHDESTLDKINLAIRQHFLTTGDAMIARTKINGRHYLKFTLLNPATHIDTIKQLIEQMNQLGLAQLKD